MPPKRKATKPVPVESDIEDDTPPPPPKKRAKKADVGTKAKASMSNSKNQTESLPAADLYGVKEDPSNASKGLLCLPNELIAEILSDFPNITALTRIGQYSDTPGVYPPVEGAENFQDIGPVLPSKYHERPRVLRALSQACVSYRKVFGPMAWEKLDACVRTRGSRLTFYKDVGTAMERKCQGLLAESQEKRDMVREANLALTRYKTNIILPPLVACLKSFNNLHRIHVLHAHTQMTTAIRVAFEGTVLPSVREAILPGHCHEILRCCPEVRSVRLVPYSPGDENKLVGAMIKCCKKVEEFRCGRLDLNVAKRLKKAAPNLGVVEVHQNVSHESLDILKTFPRLHTLELAIKVDSKAQPRAIALQAPALQHDIKRLRLFLKTTPSKERKFLKLVVTEARDPTGLLTEVIDVTED